MISVLETKIEKLKDGQIKEYAPIIIPTLNRINHLKRCIESLQNNTYADRTDLIIGIDYPAEEKYIEGYREVCSYLEAGVSGFNKVKIIKHSQNLGAYNNYVFLKKYVKEKYTSFIFLEDDNECSPDFLDYINKGLCIFENDENIIAICSNGITKIEGYKGSVALTQNFSAQGYGTWCKKEDELNREITRAYFERLARNREFVKKMYLQDVSVFYSFKSAILSDQRLYQLQDKQIPIIDMTIKVYMLDKQLYAVAPVVQTSRNYGYDGSGINCPKMESSGEEVVIDLNREFKYVFDKSLLVHKLKNRMGLMDYVRIMGCKIKLLCYFMNKHN